MAEPPSYEEITSGAGAGSSQDQKVDRKIPQAWSIREQVGLSRTQHVASVVAQIIDHIRERALQGLSRTTLVMIPSDQGRAPTLNRLNAHADFDKDASRKGTLVGFPDGDVPTMIQFEGRQNGMQFWQQDEALSELKSQLHLAVSDGVSVGGSQHTAEQYASPPLPPPPPQAPRKTSWFGRKSAQAPQPVQQVRTPAASPVTVDVQMDEIHFRSETEYGLYETLRARAVVVNVDIH